MENKLSEFLKNPAILNELMKSNEGKNIAARIISLKSELNMLPLLEKLKFEDEFAHEFAETLERFERTGDQSEAHVDYSCYIFYVVIFVILCKLICHPTKPNINLFSSF